MPGDPVEAIPLKREGRGAPIPRTLEGTHVPIPRTSEGKRTHTTNTENHIITTKTTSQRATAEKWLGKVHRSQAFGQSGFFGWLTLLCRVKLPGKSYLECQCLQG